MTAFYSVGQLWYESRVSWRLKRCFFVGRVVNTALSGIEAFLSLESTVPIAYVAGDLSDQEGGGRCSCAKGRTWACSHNDQQGGTAFLEIGTL